MSDESDTEISRPESPSEDRLYAFRLALATWKRDSLNSFTENQQDPTKLNSFLATLTSLFFEFQKVLEGNRPSSFLEHHELWKRLTGEIPFFPVQSPLERTVFKQILYRDLVEFPFTFNTDLIDRFPEKNSLEDAEILSSED